MAIAVVEVILDAGVTDEEDVWVGVTIKGVGLRSPGDITREAERKKVGFGVGVIADDAAWAGLLDGAGAPKDNLCALPGGCAGGIPNPSVCGPGIELGGGLDVYVPVVVDRLVEDAVAGPAWDEEVLIAIAGPCPSLSVADLVVYDFDELPSSKWLLTAAGPCPNGNLIEDEWRGIDTAGAPAVDPIVGMCWMILTGLSCCSAGPCPSGGLTFEPESVARAT